MPTINVPIDTKLFIELANFLSERESPRDPTEVIASAINYWMDNADWKPEILAPEKLNKGYSWKSLFLPQGSQLRISCGLGYSYAEVQGDQLIFDGEPTSPNQFAMKAGGGSPRDAWRDLWVKRPGDKEFLCANSFRDPASVPKRTKRAS